MIKLFTIMMLVCCSLTPADASFISCKADVESLLPLADIVAVGEVKALHDGSPSVVVLEVEEYLLGSGAEDIQVSYEPESSSLCPDRFDLTVGVPVIVFLERTASGFRAVYDESGIIVAELRTMVEAAIQVTRLSLDLEVEPAKVGIGQRIAFTHTLKNNGGERFEGCVDANSKWGFKDLVTYHSISLDHQSSFLSRKCSHPISLDPGDEIVWERVTGMPIAIEHGLVEVTAHLRITVDSECNEGFCGDWPLHSRVVLIESIPSDPQ